MCFIADHKVFFKSSIRNFLYLTIFSKIIPRDIQFLFNFSALFNASEILPCDGIFDRFHKCESDFINHALNTSNPFTMCTDVFTYGSYTNMTLYFDLLHRATDKTHYNETCSDEFLCKNQMTVITTIVDTSKSLWETAFCNDCYNVTTSALQVFSNHTIEIKALYVNYTECTISHHNASSICQSCEKQYLALNEKFEAERKNRNGNICFDLVDIVIKTYLINSK